jgi:hypothetical protein
MLGRGTSISRLLRGVNKPIGADHGVARRVAPPAIPSGIAVLRTKGKQ